MQYTVLNAEIDVGKDKVGMRNNGLIWSWVTLIVGMGNKKWETGKLGERVSEGFSDPYAVTESSVAHQSPSQGIHC